MAAIRDVAVTLTTGLMRADADFAYERTTLQVAKIEAAIGVRDDAAGRG
jgi:hypothetical protein